MIIVMQHNAKKDNIGKIKEFIEKAGLKVQINVGEERTVIGVVGDKSKVDQSLLANMDEVLEIIEISKPFKRAAGNAPRRHRS